MQQVKVAVLKSLRRVVQHLGVLGTTLALQGTSALVRDDVAHLLLGAQIHRVAQISHSQVADIRLVPLMVVMLAYPWAETHRLPTGIAATASDGIGAHT